MRSEFSFSNEAEGANGLFAGADIIWVRSTHPSAK